MAEHFSKHQVEEYLEWMLREERSEATRKQYRRELFRFLDYVGGEVAKEQVIEYKETLRKRYRPSSVNTKLAALNSFFSFLGHSELKVKQLKIQKKAYCSREKELSKPEYLRMVKMAEERKDKKLALMLQTICGTGMRVSELQFVIVEAVRAGEAVIAMKGKLRTILIFGKLKAMLETYIRGQNISSGPVFVTRTGRPLDRSNIWKRMKALARQSCVEEKKVFPHNLRHLFARCFYAMDKDIAKLADILGHSNVNTTRIYIISTGQEHCQRMDALGLVV